MNFSTTLSIRFLEIFGLFLVLATGADSWAFQVNSNSDSTDNNSENTQGQVVQQSSSAALCQSTGGRPAAQNAVGKTLYDECTLGQGSNSCPSGYTQSMNYQLGSIICKRNN